MVTLKQARTWRRCIADGEIVRLEAEVRAGQHAGSYDIVTGVIPGHDPQVSDEQIVLSCHLDHQRPGANDNASGCATILEIARILTNFLREGRIEPPRRTIRFIWPALYGPVPLDTLAVYLDTSARIGIIRVGR